MFKVIVEPNKTGDVVFFGHALVGESFTFNGKVYTKQTSRTANVKGFPRVWFKSNDLVTII